MTIFQIDQSDIQRKILDYLEDKDKNALALINQKMNTSHKEIVEQAVDRIYIQNIIKIQRSPAYYFQPLRQCMEYWYSKKPYRAFFAFQKELELFWTIKPNKAEFNRILSESTGIVKSQKLKSYSGEISVLIIEHLNKYKESFGNDSLKGIKGLNATIDEIIVPTLCESAENKYKLTDSIQLYRLGNHVIQNICTLKLDNSKNNQPDKNKIYRKVANSISKIVQRHIRLNDLETLITITPFVTKELIDSLCE
ncbi:MAG: hypothetical protein H0V82_13120 [Candidatus Protochlamydia sp.]|nr:hypothetical protein [Candidatus Protochlamydia sp.]